MKRDGLRAVAGLLALALLVAGAMPPTPASAHAELIRSEPAQGAALREGPRAIELWFSERLEPGFTSVEILTSDGSRIPAIEVADDASDPTHVTVRLPEIDSDWYTLIARTVSSEDGHASVASTTFAVLGSGGALPGGSALTPDLGGGASRLGVGGRWLTLVGLAAVVGGGAVAFAAFAAPEAGPGRRLNELARDLFVWVAGAGALVAILGDGALLLAQNIRLGGSFADLISDTRFGHAWLARVGAAIAVVAIATLLNDSRETRGRNEVRQARRDRRLIGAAVLAGLLALWTIIAVGHAAAAPGHGWAQLTGFVHLALAEAWLGGIAFLAVLLAASVSRGRAMRARFDPAARLRLVSWFSQAAAVSVLLLAASGTLRALGELPALDTLFGSGYGRWLLVKLALIAPLLGVGLLNRRILEAANSGAVTTEAALRRLRTLLPAEALLGAAVLLGASALGQSGSPRAASATVEAAAFASPVPQLSSTAMLGAGVALGVGLAIAALAIYAPSRTRSAWTMSGLASAGAAGIALAVFGGTHEAPALAAAPPPLALAPSSDCARIEPGANLAGCDFGGRDLSGVNLRGANLTGARLDGARMVGTRLQETTLLRASLRGVELRAAYLQAAILVEADLGSASLRGANLTEATLDNAALAGADLTGADFAHASLRDADLGGAILSETTLTDATLSGVNWAGTACPKGPEAIPGGLQLCGQPLETEGG